MRVVSESHTGKPYTRYPTSTGFETVKAGQFVQNNERLPGYFNADIKLLKHFRFDWWPNSKLTLYLDVRNISDKKNVRWVDSNGRIGGELGDPSGYYNPRRTMLGLMAEF